MDMSRLNTIAAKIQGVLGAKLIELGRVASGRLINSLRANIEVAGDLIDIRITGEDYWRQVEYGTPADKVPYSGGKSSGAASSKYINGLMSWIRTKGMAADDDKVKQIAFAIANTHKKRGNPVNKSKLGFIKKSQPQLDFIGKELSALYQAELDRFANENLPKQINL